jgi:hypothetical protein
VRVSRLLRLRSPRIASRWIRRVAWRACAIRDRSRRSKSHLRPMHPWCCGWLGAGRTQDSRGAATFTPTRIRMTEQQAREAVEKYGSQRAAARALDLSRETLRRALKPDRAQNRATKARYRAAGLCLSCGTRIAAAGMTVCDRCAHRHRIADRSRWDKRQAAGLCKQCGCRPLATSTHCRVCANRNNEVRRTRYVAQKAKGNDNQAQNRS